MRFQRRISFLYCHWTHTAKLNKIKSSNSTVPIKEFDSKEETVSESVGSGCYGPGSPARGEQVEHMEAGVIAVFYHTFCSVQASGIVEFCTGMHGKRYCTVKNSNCT